MLKVASFVKGSVGIASKDRSATSKHWLKVEEVVDVVEVVEVVVEVEVVDEVLEVEVVVVEVLVVDEVELVVVVLDVEVVEVLVVDEVELVVVVLDVEEVDVVVLVVTVVVVLVVAMPTGMRVVHTSTASMKGLQAPQQHKQKCIMHACKLKLTTQGHSSESQCGRCETWRQS